MMQKLQYQRDMLDTGVVNGTQKPFSFLHGKLQEELGLFSQLKKLIYRLAASIILVLLKHLNSILHICERLVVVLFNLAGQEKSAYYPQPPSKSHH